MPSIVSNKELSSSDKHISELHKVDSVEDPSQWSCEQDRFRTFVPTPHDFEQSLQFSQLSHSQNNSTMHVSFISDSWPTNSFRQSSRLVCCPCFKHSRDFIISPTPHFLEHSDSRQSLQFGHLSSELFWMAFS